MLLISKQLLRILIFLESFDRFFFEILVVLMLLAGVGNSVFHPVDYALLSSSIDESRIGRAFSLLWRRIKGEKNSGAP